MRRKDITEVHLTAMINDAAIAYVKDRGNLISVGACEGVVRAFVKGVQDNGYVITERQIKGKSKPKITDDDKSLPEV